MTENYHFQPVENRYKFAQYNRTKQNSLFNPFFSPISSSFGNHCKPKRINSNKPRIKATSKHLTVKKNQHLLAVCYKMRTTAKLISHNELHSRDENESRSF